MSTISNDKQGPIIGIDFGTTKTMVAEYDPAKRSAVVRKLGERYNEIPSSIYVKDENKPSFGDEADEDAIDDPTYHITRFKMLLGKHTKTQFGNQVATPIELAASFLSELRKRLESKVLNREVEQVVLTVPAKFLPAQRKDLEIAAERAGFKHVELLREPVAAGIYYCDQNTDRSKAIRFLVADWGGGTLDLAVVERNANDECRILDHYIDGSGDIGGEDLDDELWIAVSEMLKERGFIPSVHEQAKNRREVKRAKENLSKKTQVTANFSTEGGKHERLPLDRIKLEEILHGKIHQGADLVEKLVTKCRKNGCALDFILLVGGTSKMPMILNLLEKIAGLPCFEWNDGSDAIALGAAIRANQLWGNSPVPLTGDQKSTSSGSGGMGVSLNSGNSRDLSQLVTGDSMTLEAIQTMTLEGRYENAFPLITEMVIESPSDEVFYTWNEVAICVPSGEMVLRAAREIESKRGSDFWSAASVAVALAGLGKMDGVRNVITYWKRNRQYATYVFLGFEVSREIDDSVLENALNQHPNHPWFLPMLARRLNERGKGREAVEIARKTVISFPFSISCRFQLFMTLCSLGDPEANEHLRVMEKISSETLITRVARLFWMSKMGLDCGKVDELFKKVIDDPRVFSMGNEGVADLHVFRAGLRDPECEIDLVIKDLHNAISIFPDHELAKVRLEELANFPPSSSQPGYSERKFNCPNPQCGKEMVLTPGEFASKIYKCPYCKQSGSFFPQNNTNTAQNQHAVDATSKLQKPIALVNVTPPIEVREIQKIIRTEIELLPQSNFFDPQIYIEDIPTKKLRNAILSYANVKSHEILLFHDSTVLGGAQEGIVMTISHVLWKDEGELPRRLRYDEISSLTENSTSFFFKAGLKVNGMSMTPNGGFYSKALTRCFYRILLRISNYHKTGNSR